jgi:hypothetical protein
MRLLSVLSGRAPPDVTSDGAMMERFALLARTDFRIDVY